jgi:hypothetical protein
MDTKTKNGLIVSGVVLGLFALYFIITKKGKVSNNTTPFPTPPPTNDPYFMVDKPTKIKEIQDYVSQNGSLFLFADTYAKSLDEAINAWYAAIQKNQPTFTFYNSILLSNKTINTKTGERIN